MPIVLPHVQVRCQRLLSDLSRYPNATPRAISAISTISSARYNAENIVAYQAGNAANMPAPATTSQTSLPSQNGPIVSSAAVRCASVFPTIVCSIPTPKSNPSSTKKPTQKNATITNQMVCSCTGRLLVGECRHRFRARAWRAAVVVLAVKITTRITEHQDDVRRAQRDVDRDEHDQADPD